MSQPQNSYLFTSYDDPLYIMLYLLQHPSIVSIIPYLLEPAMEPVTSADIIHIDGRFDIKWARKILRPRAYEFLYNVFVEVMDRFFGISTPNGCMTWSEFNWHMKDVGFTKERISSVKPILCLCGTIAKFRH